MVLRAGFQTEPTIRPTLCFSQYVLEHGRSNARALMMACSPHGLYLAVVRAEFLQRSAAC